ncbi:MAG: glycerophosphodiester phosphodiesterase [Chitinophagia bacterium]|nr:glycerophosphodiester phosphodiesterase [Chitinophagia bacterium]
MLSQLPTHSQTAFDLQGHRGCRGLMPENTIPAMIRALQLGVSTLEMDVVISRDSQVVVSHDPYMNAEFCLRPDGSPIERLEEREFRLYGMDYAEIARWDVGSKPYAKYPEQRRMATHKPRLEDLIDSVEQYARTAGLPPPHYNIETKCRPAGDGVLHPDPGSFLRLLIQVVIRKKINSRTTIQSFDIRTLQIMHETHPHMQASLLVEASDKAGMEGRLAELGFTPAVFSPAWQLVTPELVKACHDRGVRIIPWTVNESSEMERLRSMGVDGLITDYPDRFPRVK